MVLSIMAGLLFGLAVAGVNTVIMHRAIQKGTANALLVAVTVRMVLDVLALVVVYLTRDRLPFVLFQPAIIATAVGLSAGIISLAILTSRHKGGESTSEKEGE